MVSVFISKFEVVRDPRLHTIYESAYLFVALSVQLTDEVLPQLREQQISVAQSALWPFAVQDAHVHRVQHDVVALVQMAGFFNENVLVFVRL